MADKIKKVDKKFILSDSTVNCYGFRLLTSGYQLADFARNPIGYYMHRREDGVVLRWEDIKVEGDKITGYPVINLAAVRGQQTLDEVVNGFLNAASVGDIVVLEYSYEPEMMLPGQTGPTITKWTHKECSVVDVPGNSNALTRLFDNQDNVINLADLTGSQIPQFDLNNDNNMKKINLALTAGLLTNLKFAVTADPKENEIAEAIQDLANKAADADTLKLEVTNLKKEKGDLELEVSNLKSTTVKKDVTDQLDKALAENRITQALSTKLAADYAANPTGLKNLLADLPKYQSVVGAINSNNKASVEDLSGKTWDELFTSGKLADLKANDWDGYAQVFKKEFGKEPKK